MPQQTNKSHTHKMIRVPQIANKAVRNNLSSDSFKCFIKTDEIKDEGEVELLIYEQIGEDWFGEGVTAAGVVDFLNENKDRDIRVRINSPGGLVFDGVTIHNALVAHKGMVYVDIEGIAASSATVIAVAGDEVRMNENASFFIHRAWGFSVGNEAVMRDTAKTLTQIDKQIAATLAARSNLSKEEVLEMMKGEVDGEILGAEEALEHGFIDSIIPLPSNASDDATDDDNEDQTDDDLSRQAANNAQETEVQARLERDVQARMRILELANNL